MSSDPSQIRRRQGLLERLVSWWSMDAGSDQAALLAAARAGDQVARGELHGLARGAVRSYLARAIGRRAERTLALDDLEQEAFLHAFEVLPRLEEIDSLDAFRALVLRHARWRVFKEVRRNRRFAGESEISKPLATLGEAAGVSEAGEVTRHDQLEHLASQVDRLPEKQAEVIRLRMMGTEFAAIAGALGIGEEAVRKRYTRGLVELRALMDGSGS